METNFRIITPTYNCEEWIQQCIDSVKNQTIAGYTQIFVDDGSTDGTVDIIKKAIKHQSRFKLVQKESRMGVMHSHVTGAELLLREADDEDVIVHLDGDDWFKDGRTLERIRYAYEGTGCWATYGNYSTTDGSPSVCRKKVPKRSYREHIRSGWCFSHTRTFKKFLWDKILVKSLLDSNGVMFSSACDVAIFCAALEMAGDRVTFVKDIGHVYNRGNPLNEDKDHLEDQVRCALEIAAQRPYEAL
jgi:glycosyltransferase involved in cell wall biosynthesis